MPFDSKKLFWDSNRINEHRPSASKLCQKGSAVGITEEGNSLAFFSPDLQFQQQMARMLQGLGV